MEKSGTDFLTIEKRARETVRKADRHRQSERENQADSKTDRQTDSQDRQTRQGVRNSQPTSQPARLNSQTAHLTSIDCTPSDSSSPQPLVSRGPRVMRGGSTWAGPERGGTSTPVSSSDPPSAWPLTSDTPAGSEMLQGVSLYILLPKPEYSGQW